MKITYRLCGDYYLPNITIPAEDQRPCGKYGRMRLRYLREHRPILYNELLLTGKLTSHLHSIDNACKERYDLLIQQLKLLLKQLLKKPQLIQLLVLELQHLKKNDAR